MPNWCETRIEIKHEDKTKLESFNELLKKWTGRDYTENGFGLNWLGNIVGNSGIGTVDKNRETDIRCRGSIVYSELFDNQLIIDTETAWTPLLKMWVMLTEKYLQGAEITYSAVECGMEIYCTNDMELIDHYIIDCWGLDEKLNGIVPDYSYDTTEDNVICMLQKLLHSTETNAGRLLKQFNNSEYSKIMSVNKWKFADIAEWD